jgi:putative transposase
LRNGARALLAKAVEAEVADFLGKHADFRTQEGQQRVIRHGHLPEREVMTGIGPVTVRQPRVRDRAAAAGGPGQTRFSPSILPSYMRRSKSIETLLPILYLKGISTGDFSEALAALLGQGCCRLRPSAASKTADMVRRYVYIWADGIHLETRLENADWQKRDLSANRKAVRPGADRRDAGRPQETDRLHRCCATIKMGIPSRLSRCITDGARESAQD